MKIVSSLLVIAGLASHSVSANEIGYKYLGRIETPSPAFINIEEFPGQPEFLLISEFGMFISGKVAVIPNIADAVKAQNFEGLQTHILSDQFLWANNLSPIPQDVFGDGSNAITVPDGFLPPTKTDGGIYILTTDPQNVTKTESVVCISTVKSGFFYHEGYWVDIDGDGLKDYLTARTNTQPGQGELVWFKHPEGGLKTLPWQEHVITKGPDVMFDIDYIMGYEGLIIFASEFFTKRLVVYQISIGATNGGQVIRSRVIDDQLDQAYSISYLDINGDGKKELLVNNHESDNTKAAIFLYTVPSDFFNGSFVRSTIASGFQNAFSYTVPNMCPGFPLVVNPKTGAEAHILVAGDGDYSAHLMRPQGNSSFKREVIKNLGGTVGYITAADLNGNGYLEFFVPNYDESYIEVYEFYDGPNQVGPQLGENTVFLE